MNPEVTRAYGMLVPRDQIVVDAMIISLYEKDAEVRRLAQACLEVSRKQLIDGEKEEVDDG